MGFTSLPAFAQQAGYSSAAASANAGNNSYDTQSSNTLPSGDIDGAGTPSIRNNAPDAATPQRLSQPDPQDPRNRLPNRQSQRPAQKPEENEFQRFIFNTTGQRLPLFGQQYFDASERNFTPLERVPVPADYVLGPGDELYIRAWGNVDIDYRTTIDRNGQINLPKVGTIGVAGLKANEVEGHINSQIGRVFKNYSLNVTLGQLRSIQVFVVGQARSPGSYTVGSLSTLVNVVFASGGPGPNGSMRRVQLKRANQVVAELDLYDFMIEGSKGQDQRLLPGDVIVFLPAGPRVALLGAVDTPAVYELRANGEPLSKVIGYAGGARASTNQTNAQLERIDSTQPRAPRTVATLDPVKNGDTPLRDGDVLSLFQVAPQFANAVTLRGNVAQPLRYPFTTGMRISQLIPDREALITPDYYRRKNKLVQYTDERSRLTNTSPDGRASLTSSLPDGKIAINAEDLTTNVRNILDEPNWDYAAIERLSPSTLSMEVIPFNLAKAVIEHDPASDLELRPGDVVTIFGRKDLRNPLSKQTRLVRVEGEVSAPGVYQVGPDDTLPKLLARAGGLTPQAYLYGIEFAREETRIKQQQALEDTIRRLESELTLSSATAAANRVATNDKAAEQLQAAQLAAAQAQLAKLRNLKANGRISLELEPSLSSTALPDLRLEDGDRVTVPHTPAYVFAVGSVANNNALLWRKGKKLSEYLDNAGVEVDADPDAMFVVRADGSVVHASRRGWFSNIEKLELLPGDTVVVPGKTNRETFWTAFIRGLKDWSQILYQFGLTAAAIQTLKN